MKVSEIITVVEELENRLVKEASLRAAGMAYAFPLDLKNNLEKNLKKVLYTDLQKNLKGNPKKSSLENPIGDGLENSLEDSLENPKKNSEKDFIESLKETFARTGDWEAVERAFFIELKGMQEEVNELRSYVTIYKKEIKKWKYWMKLKCVFYGLLQASLTFTLLVALLFLL